MNNPFPHGRKTLHDTVFNSPVVQRGHSRLRVQTGRLHVPPALAGGDHARHAIGYGHDDRPGIAVRRGQHFDQSTTVCQANRNWGFLVLRGQVAQYLVAVVASCWLSYGDTGPERSGHGKSHRESGRQTKKDMRCLLSGFLVSSGNGGLQ